jgi:hypothetical protein
VHQPSLALALGPAVLVVVALASLTLVVLVVIAPWRPVRDEPPLDEDTETRLLLQDDPDDDVAGVGEE